MLFERIREGRVEEGCQVAVLTVRKGNEQLVPFLSV